MSFFHRKKKKQEETPLVKPTNTQNELSEWEEIPAYIPVNQEDVEKVSLIAAAIAAGDSPEKELKIKKIYQRNPEATFVSLIATAVTAGDGQGSFKIKSIKKKRGNHA